MSGSTLGPVPALGVKPQLLHDGDRLGDLAVQAGPCPALDADRRAERGRLTGRRELLLGTLECAIRSGAFADLHEPGAELRIQLDQLVTVISLLGGADRILCDDDRSLQVTLLV